MKVGISACSNGHPKEWQPQIEKLVQELRAFGVEAVLAGHVLAETDEFSGSDQERADDLMRLYRDDSIKAIYDISGGDLANGVLDHLDYELIGRSKKEFWGYSDLTTVINAIYAMTGRPSVLYQVKNMVYRDGELQKERFRRYLAGDREALFGFGYEFLQGSRMEGIVLGGNIRCFTKLAGTRYWPDLKGKILLLESYGGESGQIATLLTQLEQIGVFEQVSGVLLGTFTNYEKANLKLSVYDLLKMHIDERLPVAMTREIGHGTDARAIEIGRRMRFE
ncbi:MAG: LD-carboxypeptidase [Lachnospiraceae bacterium]|nr:LD-carboxypeptidase [Lachnospiraceae bacterium]